jgi:hypothetical protein
MAPASMGAQVTELYYALPAALLVCALWDGARRHYAIKREEIAAKSGEASEAALNLDRRIKDVENGQRELLARMSGAAPMSRFQKR